jgi:glyoxylase-like metal-dependent hydrolase (beta-lactamase superfamily II)/rhodanese-related sulfurtransferase
MSMSQMTCEQLYNLWMSEPQLIRMLDLRPQLEYQKAHIPGAVRIGEDELEQAMMGLAGRLAVLIAPDERKAALQALLSGHESYVFLNDCQNWNAQDLPLAGQALQKILRSGNEPSQALITRSFFEPDSQALSYMLADAASGEAVLVDPQPSLRTHYQAALRDLKLKPIFVLQTHQHAREWQDARQIARDWGAQLGGADLPFDLRLEDGQELLLGEQTLRVIETPGHTAQSLSYYFAGHVLTGDTLLIQDCGRPGSYPEAADELYASIHEKLYQLPEETRILPAHDAEGRLQSTIGEEKKFNQALPWQRTRDEFMKYLQSRLT